MTEQTVTNQSALRLSLNDLQKFQPFANMDAIALKTLMQAAQLSQAAEKKILFRKGAISDGVIFLVRGEVALIDDQKKVVKVNGGSKEARMPISDSETRAHSAMTLSDVVYISFEKEAYESAIKDHEQPPYIVEDLTTSHEDPNDWMTTLLRSKIYQHIPPKNIQALFMSLESKQVRKGEIIINEGEVGETYFIICKGEAEIKRTLPNSDVQVRVGKVSTGKSFGEEALLSGDPRNATVTMTADGLLKLLPKKKFKQLLQEPVEEKVTFKQAQQLIAQGSQWLDVRLESEHQSSHTLKPCVNIPLYRLRESFHLLNPKTRYVIVCDTGKRSQSALFLLSENGFSAVMLDKGLTHYQASLTESL